MVNSDFVERYQLIYNKDPKTKLFAPLAEGYRKMGQKDKALEICEKGVKLHPHFPSGRVALAKIYFEMQRYQEAADHLRAGVELSPENIMAHSLLADCLLKLKDPKGALRAFKMVLFLNPADQTAQKNVRRLEALTADEFEGALFEMNATPPPEPVIPENLNDAQKQRALERMVSLADAFMVRNDIERALTLLSDAELQIGEDPEITKRKKFIKSRLGEYQPARPKADQITQHLKPKDFSKIQLLETLLQRINDRKYT